MRAITDHSPHPEEALSLIHPLAERSVGAVSKGEGTHSVLGPSFETLPSAAPQDEVQ